MINEIWKDLLKQELGTGAIRDLMRFIDVEYQNNTLYPPKDKVFRVFDTPPDQVKCVILGQDPYHQKGQAMGLSFSVPKGVAVPKSLQNIYKEINNEFGFSVPKNGDLTPWAVQGVFLLNASLCVKDSSPGVYMDVWKPFTDSVIKILNRQTNPMVFMLWGAFAQQKSEYISDPHLLLTTSHPSPLSAHRGFLGCGHFQKCNDFLTAHNIEPIDWKIEDKETDHG